MYNRAPPGGGCALHLPQYSGQDSADLNSLPSILGADALTSPLLEAVALACERDWRMLFERLELRLVPGEMLQVAGPNGSGKTSLLRLLAGLMQPTAGEVRLNGQPLSSQRQELARNLLWIGHAAGIKGLLTAEENLTWLCALHLPAEREAIWQALAAVGLRGFEDVVGAFLRFWRDKPLMGGIPHERQPEAEGATFDRAQSGRRSVRQLHLKEFHSVKTKFMRSF